MKDELFKKLSINEKLNQINKSQRFIVWYNYLLFIYLILLMGIGFVIF